MNRKIIFTCLVSISLIFSCGSIPDVHYYMIDASLEKAKSEQAKYDRILGIETFKADRMYEGDRIVYRDSPYEVKFYNYHRWINPPKDIVTQKAIEQFSASGLFKQVVAFPHFSDVDYLVRGTIKAFEELDEETEWYGHVTLQLELVNMKDNSLMWQDVMTQKIKANHKKPIEVVRALDLSLQACFKEAIKEIDRILSQHSL